MGLSPRTLVRKDLDILMTSSLPAQPTWVIAGLYAATRRTPWWPPQELLKRRGSRIDLEEEKKRTAGHGARPESTDEEVKGPDELDERGAAQPCR